MNRKIVLLALVSSIMLSAVLGEHIIQEVKAQEPPIEIWEDYRLDRDITFSDSGFVVKADGVTLDLNDHTITGSCTYDCGYGVVVEASNVTVQNGYIRNFANGIRILRDFPNNTIRGNVMANNGNGIFLYSSGNILRNNEMNDSVSYNFYELHEVVNDVDNSNKVDGKPIYYWMNQHNREIPSDAGFVKLVDCTNITVKDLTLRKNCEGVVFLNTTSSAIENVHISNCKNEIFMVYSDNNVLRGNTHAYSELFGLVMAASRNNTIYHNNFINNRNQVVVGFLCMNNTWDNGYEGNYWSDYTGEDLDGDGIGDTPYIIDEDNQDNYPLMRPYVDVIYDGFVDIRDITFVARAFGSNLGDPNYKLRADINCDDTIDIRDITIVAMWFGNKWQL